VPCQVTYKTGDKSSSGVDVGVDSLQPGLWVPAGAPACCQILLTPLANRAYVARFVCPRSLTVSKITFCVAAVATANDACDAGIYNADGTVLLGSAGSTLGKLNATPVPQFLNLLAPVSLVAGQVYYAAWAQGAVGGTAAQLVATTMTYYQANAFGTTLPLVEQALKDVAFPLAAGIGSGLAAFGNSTPIMALQT
jgi:hypothetical protein